MLKEKWTVIKLIDTLEKLESEIIEQLRDKGDKSLNQYPKVYSKRKIEILNKIYENESDSTLNYIKKSSNRLNEIAPELMNRTKLRFNKIENETQILIEKVTDENFNNNLISILRARRILIDIIFDNCVDTLEILIKQNHLKKEELVKSQLYQELKRIREASLHDFWAQYMQILKYSYDDVIDGEIDVFELLIKDSKLSELSTLLHNLKTEEENMENYDIDIRKEIEGIFKAFKLDDARNDYSLKLYEKKLIESTSLKATKEMVKKINIAFTQETPSKYLDFYNQLINLLIDRSLEDNFDPTYKFETIKKEQEMISSEVRFKVEDLTLDKLHFIYLRRFKYNSIEEAMENLGINPTDPRFDSNSLDFDEIYSFKVFLQLMGLDINDPNYEQQYNALTYVAVTLMKTDGTFDDEEFNQYRYYLEKSEQLIIEQIVKKLNFADLDEVKEGLKTLYKRKNENKFYIKIINQWIELFNEKLFFRRRKRAVIVEFLKVIKSRIMKISSN
ncbi:MAG: hypothetical protein ACOX56_07180 [Acholeplasmataceae bacterium]